MGGIRIRSAAWLLATVLGGLARPAASADGPTPENARFRPLGVEQGLSQATVRAMAQDRHGFIWLGTQIGLNRYDGSELRSFFQVPGDPNGLPHNHVTVLALDSEGALWVGTEGGVAVFDLEREQARTPPREEAGTVQDQRITALLPGPDGQMWIGTEGGLWEGSASRPLRRVAEGTDAGQRIRALAWAAPGELWVGTVGGLLRLDTASARWRPAALPEPLTALDTVGIRELLAAADGSLLVGTEQGLAHWSPQRAEGQWWRHDPADPYSLGNDIIDALLRDRDGNLWIGHELGVDRLRREPGGQRFARFRHRPGSAFALGSGRVSSLMQDRAGALWIGTWSGGASVLNPQYGRVVSYTRDTMLQGALDAPEVTALAALPDGLWLGTRGGLYRFDLQQRRPVPIPALGGRRVYALAPHPRGLLVGTETGLLRYTAEDGRIQDSQSLGASRQVRNVLADGEVLWVSTQEPALLRVDADSLAVLSRHPLDATPRFIAAFDSRWMLVGSATGLAWHSRASGERVHLTTADAESGSGLASPVVSSFLRARDGQLWLATSGGGLHRMRLDPDGDPASARFDVFSRGEGPVADTLSALLEDDQGRLWMSSSRGIVRFDPRSGHFSTFLTDDGALSLGYYVDTRALLGSGEMAFGGPEGFTLVDPRSTRDLPYPARALLVEIRMNDRVLTPGNGGLPRAAHLLERLDLAWDAVDDLGFRFAAPGTSSGSRLGFRFRLDGIDPDWRDADPRLRGVNYGQLPPGEYRLRVVAVNQDGLQSRDEAGLVLRLQAPVWRNPWLAGIAGVAALALLLWAVHGQWQRQQARERQLHGALRSRDAALADGARQLAASREALDAAQRSLIEQDRMASLGALVASVAQEAARPLGEAAQAAREIGELGHAVTARLILGQLERHEAVHFRDALRDGLRRLQGDLDRAGALVASFRQIAVDQTSLQRRRIVLDAFLGEARTALAPSYHGTPHALEIDCAGPIELDSYPGALFQVLANLVSNSLTHAFPPGQRGTMRITARAEGDEVEIVYSDDGAGMSEAVRERAFEPFFTTRRSGGGSGLGLHVVQSLASGLLGGSVRIEDVGRGFRLVLKLPRRAPERSA